MSWAMSSRISGRTQPGSLAKSAIPAQQGLSSRPLAIEARAFNSLPREVLPLGEEKKLTTRSMEALTSGQIEFRLVKRRKRDE